MRLHLTLLLLLASCELIAQSQASPTLYPQQLKPALLLWDFGTLESIYPSEDSTGRWWNVVHRSPAPAKPYDDYDFYQVEAVTLRPRISEMYHRDFIDYRIEFGREAASLSIQSGQDTIQYELPIPLWLAPEGPGSPLLWGSLPLKPGYNISYPELDRWAGAPPRLGKCITRHLRVAGTEVVLVDGLSVPAYRLDISSEGGSHLTVWVREQAPHYWLKVHYRPVSGREMKSQVTQIWVLD